MNYTYKAYGQDEVNERCVCRYEGCCYVPIKECPIHGDLAKQLEKGYWEEEFEDEITVSDIDTGVPEIRFKKGWGGLLFNLCQKYFGIKYDCVEDLKDFKKVKIKARKGKIVIERID